MLPQKNRLRHLRDFDSLLKQGKFVSGTLVTAKVWLIDPLKYPRRAYTKDDLKIAVVVSMKVSKSAVVRNRVKRQLREVVRLLLKEDKVRHGFLISIMAKGDIVGKEYADIEKSILELFRRGQLFNTVQNDK